MIAFDVRRAHLRQIKALKRRRHAVADALGVVFVIGDIACIVAAAAPLIHAARIQCQRVVFQQHDLPGRFVAELTVDRLHVKRRRARVVGKTDLAVHDRPRAVCLKGHQAGIVSHQCRKRRVTFAHGHLIEIGKVFSTRFPCVVGDAGIDRAVRAVAVEEHAGIRRAVEKLAVFHAGHFAARAVALAVFDLHSVRPCGWGGGKRHRPVFKVHRAVRHRFAA